MLVKGAGSFRWRCRAAVLLLAAGVALGVACGKARQGSGESAERVAVRGFAESGLRAEWKRHTIDDESEGADGTRLGDVNGDGLPDIATGWEEGGAIRIRLHPCFAKVREKWPGVTAGRVRSPEDAVFADLDGNGHLDLVSSTDRDDRPSDFHWSPGGERLLRESAWRTEPVPAARGRMRWMFAAPAEIDGRNGTDLFAGGKGEGGAVGWFAAPENARDVSGWRWHPLREMGWLMSLIPADMDGDGDTDLLLNDRKGPRRGIFLLLYPGP